MAIPKLDDIKDYNPWLNKNNFNVPKFKRENYNEIFKSVKKKKFIIAISGLRRTGKTTIIKQMGNELKGDKYFFSFEEDRFANYDALNSIIQQFIKWGRKPFIFLDEIGKIKQWAGLIKKYHDLGKAHFVVSGSSSLNISKGKESLAGRLIEYTLPTWRFSEYLQLKGYAVNEYKIENPEKEYLKYNNVFEEHINSFLIKGSFPELINETDEKFIKKYILSTTIDKIIFEDIPQIFNIKNTNLLDNLLSYICKNTGGIVHPSHLANAFNVSKDTIREYLYYLKYAYLIDFLPIEGSHLKGFRKAKKIYASCSSIAAGIMDLYEESRLVENAVFDKLKNKFNNIYFYLDSQGHEVDFTGNIIVESKYKTYITKADLKSLIYYLNKKKIGKAYVIGKYFDVIKSEKNNWTIYIIPLPMFLLMKFKK